MSRRPQRAPSPAPEAPVPAAKPASNRGRIASIIVLLVAFVALVGLGSWQMERRAWKLDLIQQVEARADAPARPLPPPAQPLSRMPAVTVSATAANAFLAM